MISRNQKYVHIWKDPNHIQTSIWTAHLDALNQIGILEEDMGYGVYDSVVYTNSISIAIDVCILIYIRDEL